ncbi:MAG: hypothetical protein R3C01_17565 [Planctomycetaceae bacterium]
MKRYGQHLKKMLFAAAILLSTVPNSGCKMAYWFAKDAFAVGNLFGTTPLIPISPYLSGKVEEAYWVDERYGKVPILDPVEGENAPIFCLDPPSADEVMLTLPDNVSGGVYFLAETSRNNVRMVVEPMVDRLGECRFYPLAGPARLHHCHYKCTIFFDETIRSHWPVPFTHTDERQEVVYIDHDHLIRCAGPSAN